MPTSQPQPGGVGTPLSRRVLAFSTDRTLATVPASDGSVHVRKVFESGSDADAEREQHVAEVLRGDGIVPVLRVGRETGSDRPFLETTLLEGRDLGAILREDGPMPLPRGLDVARALARIAARIAAIRSPEAPDGWVHRDIKPANIFVVEDAQDTRTYLLDHEHATPSQAPVGGRFTGGTVAYSPPEAFAGAAPDSSFDVFAFGLTLTQMLEGVTPRELSPFAHRVARLLVPAAIRELCAACVASDPRQRPSWTQVVQSLENRSQAADPTAIADLNTQAQAADGIRLALLAGDIGTARHLTQSAPTALRGDIERLVDYAERITKLVDDSAPSESDIGQRALAVESVLRRFPGHAAARSSRLHLLSTGATALANAPSTVKRETLRGEFESAQRHLDRLRQTVESLTRLGPMPAPSELEHDAIPPILRTPKQVLDLLALDIESRRKQHATLIQALDASEATLDPALVQESIAKISTAYGGASEITARLKERLHAFEFTISRIAGSSDAVAECDRQLALTDREVDLTPVMDLIETCRGRALDGRTTHCRGLLSVLDEIVTERPHTAPALAKSRTSLRAALDQLTGKAWALLDTARRLLTTSPIPIRPLNADINQIDRLDIAGGLLDGPLGTRADLLDTLEVVRVRVERARATRDRLARGAEEALDQGHLTTALFEMERVASNYDNDTATIGPMKDRYAQAKLLKQNIQAALETNHSAAARYQESLDADPRASLARVTILHERERALDYLCHHVTEERRARYEADRDRLRFQIFEESTVAGRSRYLESDGHAAQQDVADQITRELALLVPADGWDTAQLSQARTAIEEFRELGSRAHPTPKRSAPHPDRLRPLGAIAAAVAVLSLGAWALMSWSGAAAAAELPRIATELEPAMHWPRDDASLKRSMERVRRFANALIRKTEAQEPGSSMSEATRAFVAAAGVDGLPSDHDLTALEIAAREFQRVSTAQSMQPTALLDRFARAAHAVGCVRATRDPVRGIQLDALEEHLTRTANLRAAIPANLADDLRAHARR